jgi:VWFA-related protein
VSARARGIIGWAGKAERGEEGLSLLEAGRWTKTVGPRARRPLLFVTAVLSLATPARTGQDQPPVFRSDVDLVTVDAVVVDSLGKPVPGLTRDDFVVLEDGVAQEIAAFEGVFQPALPESTVVLTPSAAPSPPPVATNLGAPPEGASFLVVADDIHFSPGGAVLARAALERLLEESLREGDRVAILCTRTGTGWTGTLMEDREDLRAFVSRLRSRARDVGPQLMTELEALRIAEHGDRVTRDRVEGRYWLQKRCYEGPGDCTAVVSADAEALDSQYRLERRESLRTVQAAIERLGRGRGRKAVLFLSESFPHDAGEDPSQRVVRAAERANAAVYFVDVRGVVASPPWATADAPNDLQLNPSRMSADSVARITDLMARANQSRLAFEKFVGVETIAEDTGGLVLRGNNDLGPGLARISAESRSYYLVGYHPTSPSRDGRFRKIEVRLKRPGLSVRARKGYEPAPTVPGVAPRPREADADATPVTDVPLRLATYTLEPLAGGKTRVLASVEVDFSALTAERRGGRRVAHLELRVETSARDAGEGFIESLSLEGEPRPATRGQWQAVRVEFELPPGVHQVRASAREPATGKVGVVAQRVLVPEATGLRLSTPIVSDSVAAADPEASGPQPLAVAHRTFVGGAGRPLFCAFEVIGAAAEPGTGRSQVSVGFELANRDGNVVAALPGTALVPAADGRLRAVLALPLAELPADAYELRLTAEDHLANRAQTLREAFVVESAAPMLSWAGTSPGSSAEGVPVPEGLRGVLDLAGQYVVEYEKTFSQVFAEESYHQEYTDPTGRRTVRDSRADVVFVSLPGPVPWTAYRDVIEVDGHSVGDREVRMKQLFLESPGTAVEKARRILKESGRYNLGPLHRSVNFPTLALSFLLPESQKRFAFQDKGRHSLGDTETIEVAYAEQASPTIVHDESGHDVPSRGRLFIDPRTGRILRSVLEQDANGHGWLAWARIDVLYRHERSLDILVPDSMTESYGTPDSDEPEAETRSDLDSLRRTLPLHIATVARYSAYGHFEVETQESFRPAEPSPR